MSTSLEGAGSAVEVDPVDRPRRFLRGVAAMFVLGLPGVAAVGLFAAARLHNPPSLAGLPSGALAVFAALQPLLVLLVAVALGVALAPLVGLRSHALAWALDRNPVWRPLASELPLAVAVGAVGAFATAALDAAFSPYVSAFLDSSGGPTARAVLASVPVRLLYGGVTEELLLRFGFMTLVAWVAWRLVEGEGTPSDVLMWGAVVISAVLFGVGHLPAAATLAPLTPAVVARTVLLNAALGVGFGWLYWRRSLEAAMVAHATVHVVSVCFSLLTVLA